MMMMMMNTLCHEIALEAAVVVATACTWLLIVVGYWPSYNVPFYPSVYNASAYPIVVSYVGTDYSYVLAPRAKIFRRDQGSVVDMESMQALMRYNGMYLGQVTQVSCHFHRTRVCADKYIIEHC